MSERQPQDGPPTQPVDVQPSAPGHLAEERVGPFARGSSVPASWALPSPANAGSTPEAPFSRGGDQVDEGAGPSSDAPGTDPSGTIAAPAVAAGTSPTRSAPRRGRGAVLGVVGVAAAAVLVGAGFLAGTQFGGGGASDTTRLIAAPGGAAGSYDGGGPGHGGPDGGQGVFPGQGDGSGRSGDAGSAAGVAGTITSVNGSTLTLSTLQGAAVKVITTTATTVAGAARGDVSQLTVGQLVFVVGTQNSDGSYQATAITTRPSRMRGGDGLPGGQLPGGQLPGGQLPSGQLPAEGTTWSGGPGDSSPSQT